MKKKLIAISILMASTILYAGRMAEVEYIEKINQYHEEGIEKSKLALLKSHNKEVEKIAKEIINDLTKERKQLEKIRAELFSDIIIPRKDKSGGGLKNLENKSGSEFEKYYLESMNQSYKDQILLSSKVLPELDHLEVHHMAIKIVKNKGNEITKIEKIKKSLKL